MQQDVPAPHLHTLYDDAELLADFKVWNVTLSMPASAPRIEPFPASLDA